MENPKRKKKISLRIQNGERKANQDLADETGAILGVPCG